MTLCYYLCLNEKFHQANKILLKVKDIFLQVEKVSFPKRLLINLTL